MRIIDFTDKLAVRRDYSKSVAAFQTAMYSTLLRNEYKGHWLDSEHPTDDNVDVFLEHLDTEVKEFHEAIKAIRMKIAGHPDAESSSFYRLRCGVLNEATDIANLAMMACDVVGALPTSSLRAGLEQPVVE